MTDTRALQRSLFRMQLDPKFASSVFEREAEALATTGLDAEDLELLLASDPVAVRADPGGRRLTQLLGNVIAEFTATIQLAVERLELNDIVVAFAASNEFHNSIRFDRSLPMAFGEYLERRLGDCGDVVVSPIARLERELVAARRELGPQFSLEPGEIVLAPSARLIELPGGTFDLSAKLSSPVIESGDVRELSLGAEHEVLLVTSDPAPRSGSLRPVDVEVLTPMVASVLRAAVVPLGLEERRALAIAQEVESSELSAFLHSLIDEGVLQGTLGAVSEG